MDKRYKKSDRRQVISTRRLLIPSPYPLAERWHDRYPREIDAHDAARLCHRSPATARAWARGARIEALCLAMLQLHLWGCILPAEFRLRGIAFHGRQLHTRNSHALDVHEVEALAWALCNHRETVNEFLGDAPPGAPRPDRRWRPNHPSRRHR